MRRFGLFAAALLVAAPGLAQEVGPDTEVDSLRLDPGDAVVFGFGEGFDHQLLLIRHRGEEARTTPLEADEVRAILDTGDGSSELTIENATGETLYFDALVDRSGRGGYGSAPVIAVPAGQRIVAGDWDFAPAAVVIGEFSYGPHGDHVH